MPWLGGRTTVSVMWLIAGLLGMTGGLLTWTIGFRLATVSFAGSFPTTTLALMMGGGAYLMTDRRHRRWSWILILIAIVIGPFVRGAWQYFIEGPLEFGLLALLFAAFGGILSLRRKPPARDGEDGTSNP